MPVGWCAELPSRGAIHFHSYFLLNDACQLSSAEIKSKVRRILKKIEVRDEQIGGNSWNRCSDAAGLYEIPQPEKVAWYLTKELGPWRVSNERRRAVVSSLEHDRNRFGYMGNRLGVVGNHMSHDQIADRVQKNQLRFKDLPS